MCQCITNPYDQRCQNDALMPEIMEQKQVDNIRGRKKTHEAKERADKNDDNDKKRRKETERKEALSKHCSFACIFIYSYLFSVDGHKNGWIIDYYWFSCETMEDIWLQKSDIDSEWVSVWEGEGEK